MNFDRIREKLNILADAAKYDVSCASSGSDRTNKGKGLGNASKMGICHSYTADGRCVSLLKILLTNHCIFDCAYCVTRKSNDVPRAAFKVNIEGTFNVLEACVKNNVERLIYSSSASVYGDASEVPMTETHPFRNRNFYGSTKIAGEAMCRAFYDRYGLDYVGLRYMNVYGPHQDQTAAYTGVIPIMLNKIDASEAPIINGDGSQAYDFIDVRDVARSNVLASKSEATDEFYNVGTGVQTSIRELCDMILDLRNSNLKVSYEPYLEEDVRGMVQNRIACPKKAKSELGFEYRINLEKGLKDLIAWRDLTL